MSKRDLLELARHMRREPTRSELAFWQAVRGRRLEGVKFRRQQVIDRFVADFFAPSHRLVVEIDGGVHIGREEHDDLRERYLRECGLKVLRFTADEVELKPAQVVESVRLALIEATGVLSPSPLAGEGVKGVRPEVDKPAIAD
jgi:very-short-patch-repair endonuclease